MKSEKKGDSPLRTVGNHCRSNIILPHFTLLTCQLKVTVMITQCGCFAVSCSRNRTIVVASAFIKNYLRPIENRFDRKNLQVFTLKLARSVHDASWILHYFLSRNDLSFVFNLVCFTVRHDDLGYCFRGLTLNRRQSCLLTFLRT